MGVSNKGKMKAEHDPGVQDTPKLTPATRKDLSSVVVPTRLHDEQERRREKLGKGLAEKKIDLITVRESIRDQLLSVLPP